jgi:hypothetical protein
MVLDLPTITMLAQTLQSAMGRNMNPDLLGRYLSRMLPDVGEGDATTAARAYLGGHAAGAPAAPAGLAPDPSTGPGPDDMWGGGGSGIGQTADTGFGPASSLGQTMGQAQFGVVGAPFAGTAFGFGPNLATNAMSTLASLALGTGLSNPIVSGINMAINQGSKYGASAATVPGMSNLTVGQVMALLNNPHFTSFVDEAIDLTQPTTLAPQAISSAIGRGPLSVTHGYSGLGLSSTSFAPAGNRSGVDPSDPTVSDPTVGPNEFGEGGTPGPGGTGPAGGGTAGGAPGTAGDGPAGGPGGQAPHKGGYIAGPRGKGKRDVPATLQEGEFVIPRGPLAERLRDATGRELHGKTLTRTPGTQPFHSLAPMQSLADLLARAHAYFDYDTRSSGATTPRTGA